MGYAIARSKREGDNMVVAGGKPRAKSCTDAQAVSPGARAYPRPQLRRGQWSCLNGIWDFALDVNAAVLLPNEVNFDRKILVPFAPETERSGIGDQGFHSSCWYRRRVSVGPLGAAERLVLHFGAVDYHATVFINGRCIGTHEGGYTPFSFDITDWVRGQRDFELCVRALDDPHDLAKPRGKQDWELHPHSIWYPRTTGIWQTVWCERVPQTHISELRWYPPAVIGSNGRDTYADVEAVRVHPEGIVGHYGVMQGVSERYRTSLALTEVHLGCTEDQQVAWLHEAWRAVQQATADGMDVRAVTAWSLFGAFDWNSLVTQMLNHYEPGAFDVRHDPPLPTRVAEAIRELAVDLIVPSDVQLGWWRQPSRLLYDCESLQQV